MRTVIDAPNEPAMLDELVHLAAPRAEGEGTTGSAIPFVSFLRATRTTPTLHGVSEHAMCLVVQGGKILQVGPESYTYGAGGYSMSSVEVPVSGQITAASSGRPYLAVRVQLPAAEIAAVAIEAKLDLSGRSVPPGPAAFVGQADARLLDCFVRLVRLLDEPAEAAAFLATGVRREIVYRMLAGPQGPRIYRSVRPAHLGVGKAIEWLRAHFHEPVDIEALARRSRMSVSSLRHEFKATTAMAPLQFQKQLRLQEARRLLVAGEVDAGTAAFRVGYESPSQFSREYRRLFGAPPIQDLRSLRGSGPGSHV